MYYQVISQINKTWLLPQDGRRRQKWGIDKKLSLKMKLDPIPE